MALYGNVLEAIGRTPLVRLNRLGNNPLARIYGKLEMFNPGGSTKDRIGVSMIEAAERAGVLKPGGTIIEATAGNTGVGLALAAAVKGYRCIFVMPDKMSEEKQILLKAYGAEVVITPTSVAPDSPDSYNGVADRLAREIPNSFRPNQFGNPNNPLAHYLTTGPEIWEDLGGKVDVFVAGMGTGGTISGVGKFLKEKNPSVVIVGADPEGSVLSGGQPKSYKVEGIGDDFVPRTLDRPLIDEMIRVSDRESFRVARHLARTEGILSGGSCGTAVAAALSYAERVTAETNIVVLLPDTGRNYLTKFYSDQWLHANGLWAGDAHARRTVAELMARRKSRGLIWVTSDNTLQEAVNLFRQHGISQLPVLEGSRCVGSLHELTVLRLLHDGANLQAQRVGSVMGRPFPEVTTETEISEAYRLLLSNNTALLVLDADKKPTSVVTRIDLVTFYAD